MCMYSPEGYSQVNKGLENSFKAIKDSVALYGTEWSVLDTPNTIQEEELVLITSHRCHDYKGASTTASIVTCIKLIWYICNTTGTVELYVL